MAGDKMIAILAANVVRQFLMAGLLDEIRLNVVPVLLGGGVRLLDTYGGRNSTSNRRSWWSRMTSPISATGCQGREPAGSPHQPQPA